MTLRRAARSSSSAAPASSARTSCASCSARAGRRGPRRRQPALGRARERPRRLSRASFVEASITDDAVLRRPARRPRLRLPPRDLPRQPELDRRSARRPREQHADDAQAASSALSRTSPDSGRSSTRRRAAPWPRRPSTAPRPTTEECARLALARQPVPDLQDHRRVLRQLLPARATACRSSRRASRTSTGPARCSAPAAGAAPPHTVWRNVTPTFVYKALKGEPLPRGERRRSRRATSSTSRTSSRGLIACALRGGPGEVYNLASGVETSIRELAEHDQRADRQPDADRADPGARLGPLGPALRRSREGRARAGVPRRGRAARRPRAHDRVDAREPRLDRVVHGASRGPAWRSWRSAAA